MSHFLVLPAFCFAFSLAVAYDPPLQVQMWDSYEVAFAVKKIPPDPFLPGLFSVKFQMEGVSLTVEGYYDGKGIYKARFMPEKIGSWSFQTVSSLSELHDKRGSFQCVPATGANHGPVRVKNQYHFSYADGAPYLPVGTTCYAWTHQRPELQQQTLQTLQASPFNKLRMAIFPKYFTYNRREPLYFPYEQLPGSGFDTRTFNPVFFQALETQILALQALGIEAELILFHPYDEGKWGFDRMDREANIRYLQYVMARFSAFRNVWWSMANEFDLIRTKTSDDWEAFFALVQEKDPYRHLCSVHNGDIGVMYDHHQPYLTHVSVQHPDLKQALRWKRFGKPVINDECEYEGNLPYPWGNISGRELVNRAWLGFAYGIYVGHGETFEHESGDIWWSHGGELRGESVSRWAFLQEYMSELAPQGIRVDQPGNWMWLRFAAGRTDESFIYYFSEHQPAAWIFEEGEPGKRYAAETIDVWEMTSAPVNGLFAKGDRIPLPGKPYQALLLREAP